METSIFITNLNAVYFEKQVKAYCGIHAINNALQYQCVTPEQAFTIQNILFQKEKNLNYTNNHLNLPNQEGFFN